MKEIAWTLGQAAAAVIVLAWITWLAQDMPVLLAWTIGLWIPLAVIGGTFVLVLVIRARRLRRKLLHQEFNL